MNVGECMNSHVIAVSPEESAAVAARLMARHNVGVLPVQAYDGSLCGVVTDRDLILRCMAINRSAEETTVGRIMSEQLETIRASASLEQAAATMARAQVRRLPVVEGRRLVGMVSLGDLSHQQSCREETISTLREITENVHHL